MQTNLKDALKSADTIKSPLGDLLGANTSNWLKSFGIKSRRQAANVQEKR